MKAEYRHLALFAFWMALWRFFPLIALPTMLIVVTRHFIQLRRNRRNQEIADALHENDKRWAELEGFGQEGVPGQTQPDTADWWKNQ